MRSSKLMQCAVAAGAMSLAAGAQASLVITGVIDGPLTGGVPKAVELYATSNIADLSTYNLEYWFNANLAPSVTVSLAGSASAGDFIYIASESTGFNSFFGFNPDYATGGSVNGDDSLVLKNGATAIDTFGVPTVDGTGQPWEYLDGWAYRNDNTGPDGATFVLGNWQFSGINALDGATTNASAATPFPIGTYELIPEPASLALLGLGGLLIAGRRRSA